MTSLESIRPLIDQLDSEGLIFCREWVQELKLARIRHGREWRVPSPWLHEARQTPGGVQELLRQWDSKK